jgi:L-iditol 2-dehydrogenase
MAEPVSVGIWAARKSALTGGDRVLITGAGPIGLLAGQVARALGAETPVITDLSDFRLIRARDLGLRTAQAGTSLAEEFDVLLECSGAPAALSEGMRALAPTGRVALVGMGADTVSLDVALVQGRELSVTGVFRYANTYPLALQLISSGAINVTDVITHRFALEETERALTISRKDRNSLKAMVYTAHRTQARESA